MLSKFSAQFLLDTFLLNAPLKLENQYQCKKMRISLYDHTSYCDQNFVTVLPFSTLSSCSSPPLHWPLPLTHQPSSAVRPAISSHPHSPPTAALSNYSCLWEATTSHLRDSQIGDLLRCCCCCLHWATHLLSFLFK